MSSIKEGICRHFFNKSTKDDYWDCKFFSDDSSVKSLKQKKGTGWSNLFNHVQSVHQDYCSHPERSQHGSTLTIQSHYIYLVIHTPNPNHINPNYTSKESRLPKCTTDAISKGIRRHLIQFCGKLIRNIACDYIY